MRKTLFAVTLGALMLAGCTTGPETRVTRFHLNQPIAAGNIAVEPANPAERGSPEFQTYASAVGAQLAKIGFTEAPGLAKSEQVAVVHVERSFFEGPPRSAFSIGLGGGSYGWNGGVGGGVSVPIAGRPTQNVATRLTVQIKRRSDGTAIWEGRAETAQRFGTAGAQPAETVARLAAALFQGFPGVSGRTITLK